MAGSAGGTAEADGEAVIVDDGQAVHPADVIIVAPERSAFGTMSQNVIEVERFTIGEADGGGDDDALLQLASVLVRHLARPPPPKDPWEAAAAAVAAWDSGDGSGGGGDGTQPLPPVASELRRLGLLKLRICSTVRPEAAVSAGIDAGAGPTYERQGARREPQWQPPSETEGPPGSSAPSGDADMIAAAAAFDTIAVAAGAAAAAATVGAAIGERVLQRRPRLPRTGPQQPQRFYSVEVLSLSSLGSGDGERTAVVPPLPQRAGRRLGGASLDSAMLQQLRRMPAAEIASAAVQLAETMEVRLRQHRQQQGPEPRLCQGVCSTQPPTQPKPQPLQPLREGAEAGIQPEAEPTGLAHAADAPSARQQAGEVTAEALPAHRAGGHPGGSSSSGCGTKPHVLRCGTDLGAAPAALPRPLRRALSAETPAGAPRRSAIRGRPALASCLPLPFASRALCWRDPLEREAPAEGAGSALEEPTGPQPQGAALARLAEAVRRSFRRRPQCAGCEEVEATAPFARAAPAEGLDAADRNILGATFSAPGATVINIQADSPGCVAVPREEPSPTPCQLAQPAGPLRAVDPAVSSPERDQDCNRSDARVSDATVTAAAAAAGGGSAASMELLVLGGSLHAPHARAASCSRIALLCAPQMVAGLATDLGYKHGWYDREAAAEVEALGAELGLQLDMAPPVQSPSPPQASAFGQPPRRHCQMCFVSLSEPGCPPCVALGSPAANLPVARQ